MSAASKQLSLNLCSPIEHSELIHHSQQTHVVAWLKNRKADGLREWHVLEATESQHWLAEQFDQPDVFVTPNEFHGWRRISLLSGLNAIFLDFDLHNEAETADELKAKVAALAVEKLEEVKKRRWPAPSAVVYSGRGCHFYWIHNRITSKALPRWQEATKSLAGMLGADKQATDCTRVLRVLGTRHSVTGTRVWGERIGAHCHDFEDLYDRFCPKKSEVRDIIAARARKKKDAGLAIQMRLDGEADNTPRTKRGSIYQWWYLVYQDLRTIAFGNFPQGIHKSKRICFIEMFAHALSWYTLSDTLEDEILEVAAAVAPSLTLEEVVSQTSTIVKRARCHAEWRDAPAAERGKEPPGRYRFKRETIYSRLEDLIPVDMIDQLRAIVPTEVIQQRKRERDRARWSDHNTAEGVRASNLEKRAQARAMREAKLSIRKIAAELGVSYNTAYRWCE